MDEDRKNKLSLRIEKMKKLSGLMGMVGILALLSILLLDLSYPDLFFSILLIIGLALVFISAGLYIVSWLTDIHLAYKRKDYFLLFFLILAGLIFIFWQVFWSR